MAQIPHQATVEAPHIPGRGVSHLFALEIFLSRSFTQVEEANKSRNETCEKSLILCRLMLTSEKPPSSLQVNQ